MLYIITGDINSGKTTQMKALYQQHEGEADGIISEKIFQNGSFSGYRLVHLKSGKATELALLSGNYHHQFTEACRLGPFIFSAEAFRFGAERIRRACEDPAISAVFLDEVGPLELRGEGFASILPVFLRADKALFLTVRSNYFPRLIEQFHIRKYQVILAGT